MLDFPIEGTPETCGVHTEALFADAQKRGIKTLVVSARWSKYYAAQTTDGRDFAWAVRNTRNRYQKQGITLVFIADNPVQPYAPQDALRRARHNGSGYDHLALTWEAYQAQQFAINEVLSQSGSPVVRLDTVWCTENGLCPLANSETFLYYDNDHLSAGGALLAVPALKMQLGPFMP